MARWVKLPDDAQVTMSRESWESTHSNIGLKGWTVIAIAALVFYLLAGGHDASKKNDHPSPTPSVSAPAKVRH
jgi:hypothetical protein